MTFNQHMKSQEHYCQNELFQTQHTQCLSNFDGSINAIKLKT